MWASIEKYIVKNKKTGKFLDFAVLEDRIQIIWTEDLRRAALSASRDGFDSLLKNARLSNRDVEIKTLQITLKEE